MIEFLPKPRDGALHQNNMFWSGSGYYLNKDKSRLYDDTMSLVFSEIPLQSYEPIMRECGFINTNPTTLIEGENDCRHLMIEGNVKLFEFDKFPNQQLFPAFSAHSIFDQQCAFREPRNENTKFWFTSYEVWGSSGQIIKAIPDNLYDYFDHPITGRKAVFWWSTPQFLYIAQCTESRKSESSSDYLRDIMSCDVGKVTLGSSTTMFKWQTLSMYEYGFNNGIDSIPRLLRDIEAGTSTRKLSTGTYVDMNNLNYYGIKSTSHNNSIDINDTIERLSAITPSQYFQGCELSYDDIYNSSFDWGAMATDCICQLNTLSVNGLAYGADIISLKKQVSSVLKLIADFDNPKSWASVYLTYKYGIRLTISDTKDIMSQIKEVNKHIGFQKLQSSRTVFGGKGEPSSIAHLAIYYDRCSGAFADLYYKLLEFDAQPWDLENLWDLIPFSFVVDWFIAVGDLLDQLDSTNHSVAFNIPAAEYSIKWTRELDPAIFMLDSEDATLSATWYAREYIPQAPVPSYSLDVPINQGFGHWIESGALILQKFFN